MIELNTKESINKLQVGDFVMMKSSLHNCSFTSVRKVIEITNHTIYGKLVGVSRGYVEELVNKKEIELEVITKLLYNKFSEPVGNINFDDDFYIIQQYYITDHEFKELDVLTSFKQVKEIIEAKK